MVTIPILIRSVTVILIRLRKADDLALTADLVDYIHTPLPDWAKEDELAFTLDWWNSDPLPCGLEDNDLWMTFDTLVKCYMNDKVTPWPPRIYEPVPRGMKTFMEEGNPTEVRKLTDGYCRTCVRLLEFIRNLQLQLKAVRNTYRGWATIFHNRATQAQVRASGMFEVLQALAEKEAAAASSMAADGDASAQSPVELSLEEVKDILFKDMMSHTAANCLDNEVMSPAITSLPLDTRPFSIIDESAGAPPSLAPGDYPETNQGPPFARDRGLLSSADIPPDWKEADKKVFRFFAELDESVSTFDPGSVVYHRDQGLKDLLDAMPAPGAPATRVTKPFVPQTLASEDDDVQSAGKKQPRKFRPATLASSESEAEEQGRGVKPTAPSPRHRKLTPMILASSESHGEGQSRSKKPATSVPPRRPFAPMTLASSESEGEGPSRCPGDSLKRKFVPGTLSDSDVEVGAGRRGRPRRAGREQDAPAVKPEFVPATLSDSEVEIVSKTYEQSPGASKFRPMVLSSGESEQGYESPTEMMQAAASRKVKSELMPATLIHGGEESLPVAYAGEVKLGGPNPEDMPETAVDEDENSMSVDLDALAHSINNAPVYTDHRFSHIPDDMLEPNDEDEDNDEDSTEGHEYGSEVSDDAEYETDDEEEMAM